MPTFNPGHILGRPGNNPVTTVPSYGQGEWKIAIPAGALDDADNSGNAILQPSTIGAAKLGLRIHGGTELLVACLYPAEITDGKITADPVVQAFARDGEGVYSRLYLSADGTTHDLTLTAAEATDLITACPSLHASNNYKMTKPLVVRLDGALNVVLGVKTAITVHGDFPGTAALAAVLVKTR